MRFIILFAIAVASATSVRAEDVPYTATVNLSDPDQTVINIDGAAIRLLGDPITLNPGDTLSGTVLFAGGERLQISDSAYAITTFYPFISSDLSDTVSTGSLTFLGLEGDYVGPATITGNISGAVLGGYWIGDLTHSSFSFSGIQFSLHYQTGTATSFNPYVLAQFNLINGAEVLAAGAVPEPSTWAMMILGFGAIGFGMRRNRRLVSTCQIT